eukprot:4188648-Lingulodinium_polyedra.AAC.1
MAPLGRRAPRGATPTRASTRGRGRDGPGPAAFPKRTPRPMARACAWVASKRAHDRQKAGGVLNRVGGGGGATQFL